VIQQTVPTVVDIVAEVVNGKPRAGVEWRTWRRRCHPASLLCIESAPRTYRPQVLQGRPYCRDTFMAAAEHRIMAARRSDEVRIDR
jgi:hypothetical protein